MIAVHITVGRLVYLLKRMDNLSPTAFPRKGDVDCGLLLDQP